jgi:hypothetical protein
MNTLAHGKTGKLREALYLETHQPARRKLRIRVGPGALPAVLQ